jgi:hypothetical protein
MIRTHRFLLALSILVLASLACQALTGGGSAPEAAAPAPAGQSQAEPEPTQPSAQQPEEPAPAVSAGLGFETEFPVPGDASNGFDLGDGMISFQTGMSIDEALAFYRAEFSAKGYTEREILTSVTDSVFSIVFDGHANGKAIVVQAVDLGNGSVNITIRFEDV